MHSQCWDIKDCGRGPGGRAIKEHGVCPTIKEGTLDGEKGAMVCGKGCWRVRTKDDQGRLVPNWSRPEMDCLNCSVMEMTRNSE